MRDRAVLHRLPRPAAYAQWLPRPREHAAALLALRPVPPARPVFTAPGLLVGHCADGTPLVIPDEVRQSTHIHLLGPSGFGKSFLLYSMICQDILAGRGVCVIDPHSELYFMLLNFLVQQGIDPARVVVVNPLLRDWTLKFNPLERIAAEDEPGTGSSLACEAMIRVAGAQDFTETPQLGKLLQNAALVLEEAEEPLALLRQFCAVGPKGGRFRAQLLDKVTDPVVRDEWEDFNTLNRHDQLTAINSSANRVAPFLLDRRIRRMMTFSAGNVDWQRVMDEGKIVLCNLGSTGGRRLSTQARQLIGVLVMHGIAQAAERRRFGSRPFCMYCDEFGQYVSEDFADALDGFRKWGVFLTLAHQRLYQVEKESKNVLDAITSGCRIKLVFGGLGREDAERMARELYTGEVTGDEVKHRTYTRSFRPILQWVDIVSHTVGGSSSAGGSSTRTSGSSSGETTSATSTRGGSMSQSVAATGFGPATVYTSQGIFWQSQSGVSSSSSFHEAVSESEAWGETDSWSESVTTAPVTVFEEFLQDPHVQFSPLEEEWEKRYAQLMNLPRRSVVVKLTGKRATIVPTLTIAERLATPAALRAYERRVCEACPHIVPSAEAEQEFLAKLQQYQLLLVAAAEPEEFAAPTRAVIRRTKQTP